MKTLLKSLANALFLLLALPAVIGYRVAAMVLGAGQAFPGWSQAMSLVPGLLGVYLRRAFYRLVLPECAADVCITFGTVFSHGTARLGRRVYIGAYCCLGDVTLEDDVLLASNVSIANGPRQHGTARLDIPIREQPGVLPRVTIGEDSWIGERATVLADVGRHCVIGAGAVVIEPVPDYAVAVGVPAKVVKFRNATEVVT